MTFFNPGELMNDNDPEATAEVRRVSNVLRLRNYDAVFYEPDEGRLFCLQVLAKVRKEPLPVCEVVDLRRYLK